MLQLYDVNKNKIKGLAAYKDYCIESVLKTGDKTLSFLYPKRLGKEIRNEGYIRNKTDEFVIKSIDNSGDWLSINANLNVENLEGKEWESFTSLEQTIEQCLTLACVGTGWTVTVTGVTKKRTIRMTNCNSWDIIQQARKTYLVEIGFDTINRKIIVKNTLGQDKGTYFTEDLNLKKLDINNDSYDFFTRIKPIGKDGLKINLNGKDYLENYQYSNKVKTLIWKDERYTTAESLKEDATIKLEELSKPRIAYAVDVIDLAKLNSKYKNILDYGVGDTIYLVSKENNIREKQRIVKTKEYPEESERNSCEIANTVLTFEDIQKEYADTTDTVNNITSDNGTISENAISTAVKKLTVDKVEMSKFTAVEGRVGSLEVNKLSVDAANIKFASIDEAILKKANITDLTATNIKFEVAEGGTLSLQTLLSKFVSGENGQFLNLTTDNVTISNALIKDVIAKNISVEDLKAGIISTNKFNIASDNGGIEIVGATQQFKDKNNKVRIQMGQDTQGNFNFILRGEDGTTTLIDHTGIKEKAIADNLIKEKMIAENAVGEKQINYSSLVTGLNKDTNTSLIKASKVAIDLTGQSLEVSFNSLKSNVDSKETRNFIKGSSKEFREYSMNSWNKLFYEYTLEELGLKVGDTITFSCYFKFGDTVDGGSARITFNDTDLNNIKTVSGNVISSNAEGLSYVTTVIPGNTYRMQLMAQRQNAIAGASSFKFEMKNEKLEKGDNPNPVYSQAPEDVEEKIESNTTAITATQKGIEALVKDTTTTKGDVTTLKDNYTNIKATVDGINTTVAGHTTSIGKLTTDLSGVSGKVTEVETKQATLEQNLNGFKTTVSNTYSTKTELNTAKSDAINSANSSTDNKLKSYSTTTAMNSAITQSANGVKTEVSNTYLSKGDAVATYATKSSLEQTATDVIYKFTESGGYNLLKNSAFANKDIDGWIVWGGVSRYNTESYYTDVGDMYIANSSSNPGGLWQTGIPIKPNTKYTLSVTCTKEPNVKDGWFVLEYQSSIDSNVITYQDVRLNFDGQRHSYTFTTPNNSNIKYTKCGFRHEGVKSTGGGYLIKINKPCLAEGEVSVWSPNPFEVKDGSTMIDANGVTIYNGALTVKNKSNANVLTGDSNGNLTITGTFVNKNWNGVDAIKIDNTNIFFYDWERSARELGIIYSSYLLDYPNCRGFSLAHNNEGYMTLGYRKPDSSFGAYVIFDKYAKNPAYNAPIRFVESSVFSGAVNMQDRAYISSSMYLGNNAAATTPIIFGTNNRLVMQVSVTNKDDGLKIQTNTGSILAQILAGYSYPILLNNNVEIRGNYTATGSKNSLQYTEHYGERLINAYETAEYYFGDIGSGTIKDGECIVWIDDILQECINTNVEYHVFTQTYNGSNTRIERFKNYFIVYGEDNTEFSWELKAKRLGYENVRLDQPDIAGYLDSSAVFTEDDLVPITSEDLLMKELEFNLEEILREVA